MKRVLRVHRSFRGWGTFLRAFGRMLTLQLVHGVCRGSSTSTDRRRLHYSVVKPSSVLLCLYDPVQVEEVDAVSYPASQLSATPVNVCQFALPVYCHLVNVPLSAP